MSLEAIVDDAEERGMIGLGAADPITEDTYGKSFTATVPTTPEPAPIVGPVAQPGDIPSAEAAPEPVTDYGKSKQISDELIPDRAHGAYGETLGEEAGPGLVTATKWEIEDYGLTSNLVRWMDQATDKPAEGDELKIADAMPELMIGVSEEYYEHIAGQPNWDAAVRESERVRTLEFRSRAKENQSVTDALKAGFAGFVLDPINLVPGAVLVKGMSLTARAATALGMRGMAATTLSKNVAKWGFVGGGEELLRNIPRLQSDPTYKAEQYLMDAAFGVAFGGAIPLVPGAARSVGSGVSKLTAAISEAAHAVGVDSWARTVGHVTSKYKDGAAKVGDFAQVVREAKATANEAVDAKMRDISKYNPAPIIAKAMDGKSPIETLSTMGKDYIAAVGKAARKAAGKDPQAGEAIDAAMKAASDKLDAGAAQRQTTAKDVAGDVANDVATAARDAQRSVKELYETTEQMITDMNLPKEAADNARLINRHIMEKGLDTIENGLIKSGQRPVRVRLNNKDHTASVKERVSGLRKVSNSVATGAANAIDAAIPGFGAQPRIQAALSQAMRKAKIDKQQGETWADAFERVYKGASHKQRERAMRIVGDQYQRNMDKLSREIADNGNHPEAIAALEDALGRMNDELRLAQALAASPWEDAVRIKAEWALVSREWEQTGHAPELARQFVESKLQSAVKHQFAQLTESLSSRLMKTELPLAQWFTMNVLETPSGFGGRIKRSPTAAVMADVMEKQANYPVLTGWRDMLHDIAKADEWPMLKRLYNFQGSSKTHPEIAKISRDIMLEVNARQWGTRSNARPEVKKFVDTLTENYGSLHDLQKGYVDGIHAGNKIEHYTHQAWDDGKILQLLATPNGRKGVEDLFRQGYLNTGMDMDKAAALAVAMVDQKIAASRQHGGTVSKIGEELLTGEMPSLTQLVDRLRKNGTSERMVTEIVAHINGAVDGRPGYAHSRAPIDISARAVVDGKTISVVDLMDQDVPQVYMRYSKEATARRAISEATGGKLRSDKDMNSFLDAAAEQGVSSGRPVNTRDMQNALMMMMGRQYDGQLPMDIRRARDGVSLAGMGGLGESQLAEFGLAINRGMAGMVGLAQTARSRKARRKMGLELTPEQATDRKFLSELQEVAGLFEDMYLIDRRNVHFDAKNKETGVLSKIVDTATGGKFRPLLQHAQGKFTGYGMIRAWEDQITMASLTQDIAKHYRGEKAFTSVDRMKDLGIDPSPDSWLAKKFADADRKADGTVESLNMNEWTAAERMEFGTILNRYSSQQVQRTYVGELSPEMMNPWVAFMMQFRTYPVAAAEKQQARHLKFADKEAAIGMALNSGSSAISRVIRTYSIAASQPNEQDRQAYLDKHLTAENIAAGAFTYMGNAGMTPELGKYVGTAVGQDLGFGTVRGVGDTIPVLSYMDQYMKAIGSTVGAGNGLDDRDIRNIQVAAPLGTISFSNLIFGEIRSAVEDE